MNFGAVPINLSILTSILRQERRKKGTYVLIVYTNDSNLNFIRDESLLEKEVLIKFGPIGTRIQTNKDRCYNYNGEEKVNNFYVKHREIVCWDFEKCEERVIINGKECVVFRKD